MGCGSSRRIQAITSTPIQNSANHNKDMVLPVAWMSQAKKAVPISANASAQTDACSRMSDTDAQTDIELTPIMGWDTRDVETQTPVDEGFDSLDRILAKADQFLLMPKYRSDHFVTTCVDASVQTTYSRAEESTQTDPEPSRDDYGQDVKENGSFDSIFADLSNKYDTENRIDDLLARSTKMSSMESQTEPVNRAKAANTADSEAAGVLYMSELLSPFAHLEKELGSGAFEDSRLSKDAVQDGITRLLMDVEDSLSKHAVLDYALKMNLREIGVQTDNDPITDEAPEYAARPPPCKKQEMIPDMNVFEEIDKHATEAPESTKSSLRNLVNYLCAAAENDLFKVRAFFRWISNNITYDWKYMDVKLGADQVLVQGEGVCKDYCKLFGEMCKLANIRVKRIHGFAKGFDYRPGHQFHPGEDITHAWNAVFIFGAWRLIDVTWGTGYTDHTGKFQRKLNEHFFLTDPEVLIWTHFPYSEMESNYSRWQLLDKPLKLDEFNALPKVTPFFFEYNLRIRSRPQNPVVFRFQTELKITAHKPTRYKYKLYSVEDRENGALNNYVFCQLKEDRLLGSFAISPPSEGMYYFKVYARPEWQMYEDTTLKNVAIFLLECLKAKKHINPYPLHDVPWGPAQSFYDFKMKLINQVGPVIVTWGGKRKLTLETATVMLITQQLFDANNKEMDTRGIISREDSDIRITFTITPPRTGYFKLLIFGIPKPKLKGKWRLPLLASFLIDCKLTKNPGDDDPYNSNTKKDTKKKRMRVPTVR
ncbi:Kyphoscoliosis peptidase like protein [Argiope bruennichi]|uniref:Kyphoscoliosis peptidase like protein n=1 Tax=Argiope bruennichi TaxID=94029 RepID=A0A8T0F644_ARGBR|nr:Kyphoscoliosis peptidase like protein [Argiope bruennichi]